MLEPSLSVPRQPFRAPALIAFAVVVAVVASASGCFPMSDTAFCPLFRGSKLQPVASSSGTLFNSPATFDSFAVQTIAPSTFRQYIYDEFGCVPQKSTLASLKSTGIQFFISYQCANFASASTDCYDPKIMNAIAAGRPAPAGTPPWALCKSSCDSYVNSLESLLTSNAGVCVGRTDSEVKNKIKSLRDNCANNPFFNQTIGCVDASINERATCGKSSLDEICTTCSSFSTTSTCKSFISRSSDSTDTPSTLIIIIIITVGVICLGCLVGGGWWFMNVRSTRRKESFSISSFGGGAMSVVAPQVQQPKPSRHAVPRSPISPTLQSPGPFSPFGDTFPSSESRLLAPPSLRAATGPAQGSNNNLNSNSFGTKATRPTLAPPSPSAGALGTSYQSSTGSSPHYASPLRPNDSPLYTAAAANTDNVYRDATISPMRNFHHAMPLPPIEDPVVDNARGHYHDDPTVLTSTRRSTKYDTQRRRTNVTCAPTEIDVAVPRRQSSALGINSQAYGSLRNVRDRHSPSPPPAAPPSVPVPDVDPDPEGPRYYVVIRVYSPQASDELELQPGDVLLVQHLYSDGWGYAMNTTSDSTGMFPLVCAVPVADDSSRTAARSPGRERHKGSSGRR
ncbi:hypothetical protein BCR44DRAFT_1424661 [Catenaria anguillulae PL171]|uniref:SH3 domain-containing protein n=1 Tax=Catenaria anguillulae PL171 TaxID=765915 RepID=A0A1Y2I051_9FUNG|nr:hypothetical protein BCR44DRAFT_1424661 [Catenaria anguillulae PL171]